MSVRVCVQTYLRRNMYECVLVPSLKGTFGLVSSVDDGQSTSPVRDPHRWLWGLLTHSAAPHHHLRLSLEVSNSTFNITACYLFSLSVLSLNLFLLSRISRYIRSERSVILINFCLSIICSNALILVGQTQARNKVSPLLSCSLSLFVQLFLNSLQQH